MEEKIDEIKALENVISKNLIECRKRCNLTQLEVGEKINYSDKTVSKWERGENMPEISALKLLSDLYGVPIQYFFKENAIQQKRQHRLTNYQHLSITLMSVLGLWFLSIMAYMLLSSLAPTLPNLWLTFVYTIPLTFLTVLIFNCAWGKNDFMPWAISLMVWGIALSIYLTFDYYNKWLLFVVVGVLQLIAIVWYSMLVHSNRRKKNNK